MLKDRSDSSTTLSRTARRPRLAARSAALIALMTAAFAALGIAAGLAHAVPIGPCDGPCSTQTKPPLPPPPNNPRGGRVGCDDCSSRARPPKPKPSPPRGGRVGCDDCSSRARPPKPKPSPRPKWTPPAPTAFIGPAYFLVSLYSREYGPCASGPGRLMGEYSIAPHIYETVRTGLQRGSYIDTDFFEERAFDRAYVYRSCPNGRPGYSLYGSEAGKLKRELTRSCFSRMTCTKPIAGPWKRGW